MTFTKKCLGLLMVVAAVGSGACSGLGGGCALCPTTGPAGVRGEVMDDSLYLPPGSAVKKTVDGVRVEVVDGLEKGRVATTDPQGRFDLGTLTPPSRIRATKEGWTSAEWTMHDS